MAWTSPWGGTLGENWQAIDIALILCHGSKAPTELIEWPGKA